MCSCLRNWLSMASTNWHWHLFQQHLHDIYHGPLRSSATIAQCNCQWHPNMHKTRILANVFEGRLSSAHKTGAPSPKKSWQKTLLRFKNDTGVSLMLAMYRDDLKVSLSLQNIYCTDIAWTWTGKYYELFPCPKKICITRQEIICSYLQGSLIYFLLNKEGLSKLFILVVMKE